jgi:hypothetical protein
MSTFEEDIERLRSSMEGVEGTTGKKGLLNDRMTIDHL